MPGRILLGLICPLLAAAFAVAAPAADRELPAPSAFLGGGNLGVRYVDPHPDVHLTSLLTSDDGQTVTIRGDWAARCGDLLRPVTASFVAPDVPLLADGSFSASGAVSGPGWEGTYSLAGVFIDPTSASGIGSVALGVKVGATTLTCRTPTVLWEARGSARLSGRPQPQARTRYYGTTTQTLPVVLRVSRNASRVAQAALRWRGSCEVAAADAEGIAVAPPASISVAGRFSISFPVVEEPAAGQISLTTVTLRGTFGRESVGGTLQATTRVWALSSGSLVDTCRTGIVSWAARL